MVLRSELGKDAITAIKTLGPKGNTQRLAIALAGKCTAAKDSCVWPI